VLDRVAPGLSETSASNTPTRRVGLDFSLCICQLEM
jgi:hypothetical protein